MKLNFAMLLLLGIVQVHAQYKVTFRIQKLPSYTHANMPVFIAGSFNDWKPDSMDFSTTGEPLTIKLPKGTYEYKFTRGSWQRGEAGANGEAISNRSLTVENDTTIAIEILNWADHFQQPQRQSTASKNVHIIDTAFYMPQLHRYRRIWIYLPPDYSTSHKKYGVLYLHDGQNVFDEKQRMPASGAWMKHLTPWARKQANALWWQLIMAATNA